MFSPNNTSQDPDFEGPTFHEKRIHKVQWEGIELPYKKKKWSPRDDPDWEEFKPGKWRPKNEKHE